MSYWAAGAAIVASLLGANEQRKQANMAEQSADDQKKKEKLLSDQGLKKSAANKLADRQGAATGSFLTTTPTGYTPGANTSLGG